MLHEPISTTLAPPAATPDLPSRLPEPRLATTTPSPSDDAHPTAPEDLRPLAGRARRDTVAARELATTLLARGWDVRRTAALARLPESTVVALARVRRPATAARSVADDVVRRARRRAATADPSAGAARPA